MIEKTVSEGGFSRIVLNETMKANGYDDISHYKDGRLDVMITYLNIIPDDHFIEV